MNTDLQDLVMAGVKWELSELAGEIVPRSNIGREIDSARTRVTSTVVPPISPMTTVDVETATAMALRPGTIETLMRMIQEFNHPLRAGASNTVLPHVPQNPGPMMIITDIPSSDDDASGNILSGAAGEMIDKMLYAIGMGRDTVSISPLIFWRTPGGRSPTTNELELARPFVNKFIELISPRIILTIGTLAAAKIAGIDLMRAHGVPVRTSNDIMVYPIYHPNYLMLKPAAKSDVWTVLQNVQNMLKNI